MHQSSSSGLVPVTGKGDRIPEWWGCQGGAMLQQAKWKLTRSLYSIIGRIPPARPQAEAAPRPRRTVRFLGEDWGRAKLIGWVALTTGPWLAVGFGWWFFSRSSEQTQLKAVSIFVLLVASLVSLFVGAFYLYFWRESGHSILLAIGFGLLFTFYVYFWMVSLFFVIDEFFATNFGRSWQDFKVPQPFRDPIIATLGVIFLVGSFFVFRLIIRTEGSWAERADDFKVPVGFFLGGIFLLATSKALDPLLGTHRGNSLRSHLGQWGQHAQLIVWLAAIALASIAVLVLPSKKD
jgi:hypothetical protein